MQDIKKKDRVYAIYMDALTAAEDKCDDLGIDTGYLIDYLHQQIFYILKDESYD